MIPLTGFLSSILGQKKLLLINTCGFMIASLFCGLSTSLGMMVTFRCFQGAFGAALIPLSQAILRQNFPLDQQGKAMAIWGIGIMVAPILGPTLGGYITTNASWRWVFYINLPVCILALLMTWIFIAKSSGQKKSIDWTGIFFMVIGIGSLQVFLDQGNSNDWFKSNSILILSIVSALAIIAFVMHSLRHAKPAVHLKLFTDRNLACSTLSLGLFCSAFFSIVTFQPLLLERLLNYSPIDAGLTMISTGITSAIAMLVCSQLINRIPVKIILIPALLCASYSCYLLSHVTLAASTSYFTTADAFLGVGIGLFMVPLSTYALATIPEKDITEGSGLFSYGRLLGTSIGISILSTLVSRQTQKSWSSLSGHITPLQ